MMRANFISARGAWQATPADTVVLDFDETPISRAWHVVALNRGNQSPAAEAFRYFVLEHGGKILGG